MQIVAQSEQRQLGLQHTHVICFNRPIQNNFVNHTVAELGDAVAAAEALITHEHIARMIDINE